MMLDIVTKGIPFLHMAIVAVMVFAGVPRIFSYTALIWGACAIMSIPLCEEQFDLKLPGIWKYRHLVSFGVVYILFAISDSNQFDLTNK